MYFDQKKSYYGVRAGDTCITLVELWDSDRRIPKGSFFRVISFPPYIFTPKRGKRFFVYGELMGKGVRLTHVRCAIDECVKFR